MALSTVNTLSLLGFTGLLATGQVMFKHVALKLHDLQPLLMLRVILTEPAFYMAISLYGASTLLWIWILSRVPLSQALPWTAGSVILVPLLGILVFNESVRPLFWLGAGLVVCGIMLTQLGASPD